MAARGTPRRGRTGRRSRSAVSWAKALQCVALVRVERTSRDRLPGAVGELDQEAQVVQCQQPVPEQLVLVDEVAHVRAREGRARRAVAVFAERSLVASILRVAEVEAALPGERAAGARGSRRQNAVE